MQQLDLQTISVIVAALSVVVGVIMSVLSMRNYTNSRRASIFLDFHKQATQEFLEEVSEVLMEWSWDNYEQFIAKYGPQTSLKYWAKFIRIASFFDSMGKLLENKITDAKLIPEALAVTAIAWWEKIESIQEDIANRWQYSKSFNSSKFLYTILKRIGYHSPVQREQGRPFTN